MEKTLVELLHEHNNSIYRGENEWSSEAWNKIVKEFHERERHVNFTRAQIQEKKKELKRDYKMLKEARKQSGVHWNQERVMFES
uniref:Myb/SANT-like domain-containing protein n=1 Tax=Arundo donax TaxID=35708 RepID=A0A0A9F816_ARUDO